MSVQYLNHASTRLIEVDRVGREHEVDPEQQVAEADGQDVVHDGGEVAAAVHLDADVYSNTNGGSQSKQQIENVTLAFGEYDLLSF